MSSFSSVRAQEAEKRIQKALSKFDEIKTNPSATHKFLANGCDEALNLINATANDLHELKIIVGNKNEKYLELSNTVVGICAALLRSKAMEGAMLNHTGNGGGEAYKALKLMEELSQNFDMSGNMKEVFNQTMVQIQNINQKIGNNAGGCYIATIVYNDYYSKEVLILRRFRDKILKKTYFGRRFISIYYKYSPKIALFMAKNKPFNRIIKFFLNVIIKFLPKK